MRFILFATMALLLVIGFVHASAITPILEDRSSVQSPQGLWNRYYSTNERQTLTFTDWLNETGWIILDPCQDMDCFAPDENISPPLPIPPGSTFPFSQSDPAICNPSNNYCENVVNYVESNFTWTPTICQAGNYTFKSEHYIDSLWVDTIVFHVQVNNSNRFPNITSSVPSFVYVPVGQNFSLNLTATDPDKTECGDDAVHFNYTANITANRTFTDNGNGSATFSLGPVTDANVGRYAVTFTAYDNYTGTSQKNMTLVIYKPVNSPSCYFDKRFGVFVCK